MPLKFSIKSVFLSIFRMSFENSFCPDYVTEKLFRAFETGTVPVVFGGANYSNFAPSHSYINARNFETPQLLADYLLKLSQNRDLYARFFDWRKNFRLETIAMKFKKNSGRLCEILNDPGPSKTDLAPGVNGVPPQKKNEKNFKKRVFGRQSAPWFFGTTYPPPSDGSGATIYMLFFCYWSVDESAFTNRCASN